MACPQCGSWSVRADRSLAGRMVCGRCGTPLQGVQRQGGRSGPRRLALFNPRVRWRGGRGGWRWWLAGLLAAGAALAAVAPDAPRPLQREPSLSDPADAPPDRPDHRWQ
ncbi:MAG: zinc ribbon domain-containing protein [Vulcanococcus sp.]